MKRYSEIEQALKYGNVGASINIVKDKNKYSKKDYLLYFMDNGSLNLYANNNKEAFQFLEQADRYQEELYTQSISASISTYLLNDNQKPYSGEEFESLYLNIFKALSFISADDTDGAMVEIRQGINKLNLFETRYAKQLDKLDASMPKEFKTKENADNVKGKLGKYQLPKSSLLRLISLILHRDDKQDDVALIDKNKINDIWRKYPEVYNFETYNLDSIKYIKPDDKVILDILAFSGMTTQKKPWKLDVFTSGDFMTIISNSQGRSFSTTIPFYGKVGSFSISIPYVERRKNRISKSILYIDDKKIEELNLVEKTSNIAINQFEKNKNFIMMKSLARASAKAIATYKIQENARKMRAQGKDDSLMLLLGMSSSIFASASEVADIRSWNTLPDNCYFGEIALPEGEYDVKINYLDDYNNIVKTFNKKVHLDLKKKNNIIISYAL